MTTTSEPQLPERAARNQDRFRKLNERIEPHNRMHHWVEPPMPDWVCECAFEECMAPVPLTVAEYESVRTNPARFFVAPSDDHVVPDVERVVERNERYWIVEKIGDAAEMSEALDQRVRDAASQDAEVAEVVSHAADQVAWNLPPARGRT
jgi:hypothetical protein